MYKANMGTWVNGKTIKIEATTPKEAFRELARIYGGENIVQILEEESRIYVYDYMNGFTEHTKRKR